MNLQGCEAMADSQGQARKSESAQDDLARMADVCDQEATEGAEGGCNGADPLECVPLFLYLRVASFPVTMPLCLCFC